MCSKPINKVFIKVMHHSIGCLTLWPIKMIFKLLSFSNVMMIFILIFICAYYLKWIKKLITDILNLKTVPDVYVKLVVVAVVGAAAAVVVVVGSQHVGLGMVDHGEWYIVADMVIHHQQVIGVGQCH